MAQRVAIDQVDCRRTITGRFAAAEEGRDVEEVRRSIDAFIDGIPMNRAAKTALLAEFEDEEAEGSDPGGR